MPVTPDTGPAAQPARKPAAPRPQSAAQVARSLSRGGREPVGHPGVTAGATTPGASVPPGTDDGWNHSAGASILFRTRKRGNPFPQLRTPDRPSPLPRYAELHCLTNFSFLCGASHPEELVARAAELGYIALAITDRNSLAGVVRANVAAREHGLHLLIGAEITPLDAAPLVLLAPDRAAYGRLCRLITRGRLRSPKGDCALYLSDIAELGPGLIAIVLPTVAPRAHHRPEAPCTLSNQATFSAYRAIFGDRLYLAAELTCDVPDEVRLAQLQELSQRTGIPLVAANDVHYHVPERRYLQDVLTCIREQCTLAEAGTRLFANAERHLRPLDEIARRYATLPAAVARTVEIAQRCTFTLDELRYDYPHELVPAGLTAMEYLERLTWAGAAALYGGAAGAWPSGSSHRRSGAPALSSIPANVRDLLAAELSLIRELRYEHYFLTVYDLVRFARSRGILCQGRGSAANSAVCYCLGITAVDPARHDLLFERFISRERNEPPDIDVDFEHERREEVFQYIYQKYGRERAGITAEVITYRPRSAVRDVGKVLGLSLDRIDVLAKSLDWWDDDPVPEDTLRSAGLDPRDRTVQMLLRLVRQLLGFPRHLSQHVGGFVITESPLCELVPLENGALPGRTFIEWDKDDIDALGILKVDCLALGMLTAISKCFRLLGKSSERESGDSGIERSSGGRRCGTAEDSPQPAGPAEIRGPDASRLLPHGTHATGRTVRSDEAGAPCGSPHHEQHGGRQRATRSRGRRERTVIPPALNPLIPRSLLDIPPEDPAVYDMICAADTIGVFQIESRAQMSMLPRLRPRCFYDLVIEVAIVRPGPIQGGMIHPYLRRRHGLEPVTYPSEEVRRVLEKTLGVPLFQEQVMRLAVVAAGFTPGEADQLRRAMAAWRRSGQMEKFQIRLIRGMLARGYSREFAAQIYRQIRGFGEYGFPESHAASFALLVYASAWLKRHYPAAFCAALLNSQPLGFYTPAQLVRDALAHGVRVLPVDVNFSDWDCTLENRAGVRPVGHEGTEARSHCGSQSGDCGSADADRPPASPLSPWGAGGPAIRLGLRLVRGLSEEKVRGILAARREAQERATDAPISRSLDPSTSRSSSPSIPIRSIRQLARRPDVARETLVRLAAADAFRSLGLSRRHALWHILALDDDEPPLFAELEPDEPAVALPAMSAEETVVEDYDAVGFSLKAHPIGLVRTGLDALDAGERDAETESGQDAGDGEGPAELPRGSDQAVRQRSARRGRADGRRLPISPAGELKRMRHGQRVAVAGLVTVRQRPGTARGMVFMTLEDETGMANLVIRPNVWERNRHVARSKIALIAEGTVERQGEVVHVLVRRLHDLSARLANLRHRSRDFH